jgi:DNA repair protein RecN (Recombination protein N)
MLREIGIRHFAVVDEVRANFGPGLNVLTGETGAGKSIVISALTIALGTRADAELIRSGAEEAVVEAAFAIPHASPVGELLASQGIPVEKGEDIFLRRLLAREGRSRAYVSGTMTGAATLRALGEHLVDIHGQHESALLQNRRRQLELLDAFAGLTEQVEGYQTVYRRWQALKAEREALERGERDKAQRKDLLEYQIREIDAAHLAEDEEEILQAERAVLTHHEKLRMAVEDAYARLEGDEGGILSSLSSVEARLREVSRIDARLAPLEGMADEGKTLLKEVLVALRDYRERIQFDPERLETVEARLHTIGRLKKKYGSTAGEILGYRDQAALDLKQLEGAEERLVSLGEEIRAVDAELWDRAGHLSRGRGKAAKQLAQQVVGELRQLGMTRADFRVEITKIEGEDPRGSLRPTGLEEAEFLFAPNLGEGFRPLGKIASGGELSRTMLALKHILASADRTPTLIFDEVDAGVGGRMAEVVGRKLWRVSGERQVLCITHLPQIAAFADVHLRVEKEMRKGRTEARLIPLSRDDRIEELARMLGGPEKSATALKHARELFQAAQSWKEQQSRGQNAR